MSAYRTFNTLFSLTSLGAVLHEVIWVEFMFLYRHSHVQGKIVGLCIGAQHRYNIYREVGAADMPIFGQISAAERSEAAEPKTAPRLVRGLAGGAAGGEKNHAIWLHFPSKSGNNIDYRIVE